MIRVECEAEDNGAKQIATRDCWVSETEPRKEMPVYVREFAHGATVKVWESYKWDGEYLYYATFWNGNAFETVCYGGNWGGYGSATVDATPDIAAKYDALVREQKLQALVSKDKEQANHILPNRVCKVVAGRKIAKGTKVSVVRTFESCYGYSTTIQAVVRVPCNDGRLFTQVCTSISNLTIDNPAQYETPIAELAKQV